MEFALQGAHAQGTVSGTTDTFSLPGGQLVYAAGNTGVSESIVLDSASSPASYTFSLHQSPDLTPQQTPDGGIAFVNSAGKTVFGFAPPTLTDSSHTLAGHSRAVTLTLGANNTVTLAADPHWLQDPARVYPVTIDPSFTIVIQTLSDAQDCSLWGPPNDNVDECAYIDDSVGYVTSPLRTLLQFNPEQVLPANAVVQNADLALYQYGQNNTSTSVPVSVYPLTRAWTTTATWNTYDGTNAWTTSGGDFSSSPSVTSTISPTTGWDHWYPTQLVQGWVNGSIPDHGLLLKEPTENVGNVLYFYDREYATSSDWPSLQVIYQDPQGDRGFSTFVGQSLDDGLDLQVNVATGDLLVHATDLTRNGVGLPVVIDRSYNSLGGTGDDSDLGNGWRMGTGGDVLLVEWNDGSYTFQGPSGYQVPFLLNSDGSFQSPPGIDATLIQNSDGTLTLTDHASSEQYQFSSIGQLIADTDRSGNKLSFAYAPVTLGPPLASITDTQGKTTSVTVNSNNQITQITDPNNRSVQYGYDGNTNLVTATDATGKVTQYAYDGNQLLTQITDPDSNVTKVAYDGSRRVTSLTDALGHVTTFTYNNGTTVVTDANNHATTYTYDNQGRVMAVRDPLGHTTQDSWTADDHLSQETLPSGAVTSLGYDGLNNLTQVTQPTGAKASAAYGNSSFPYLPSSATDAQGNTTSFGYNSQGLPNSSVDALNHSSSLSYNSNGTVASGTDENGHVTSYGYTASGLPNSTTAPAPLGSTAATYNSDNLIASSTDGKGQSTSYSYDALGRVTSIAYADGSSIGYAYDGDGNVVSESDSTGTTSYTYDADNQLTKETLPNGTTSTYTFDPVGNLLSKTDAGGTVTYGYDAADRLTTVTEPSGATTTLSYDSDGNQIGTSYPNGVTEHQSYLNSTELSRIWATNSGNTTLDSFSYGYTNPATNQPTTQRYSMQDVAGNTTSYSYDVLNRLTGATTKTSGGTQTASYSYGYDPVGNMTSENRNGLNTSLSYNNADELTSAGGTNLSYDANGNQLSASGRFAATVNAQDQAIGLIGPGGQGMTAGYTGSGQSGRVAAGVPTFQYDALGLASLATSGTAISSAARSSSISVKDQPSAFAANGTAIYQVTVKNTGSQTWPAGGSNPVHLGIHFASKGGGYANNNNTWATDQRFNLPNDVAPGGTATIAVTVNAPSTSGNYVLEAQMVQEYVAWFPQYLDSPVSVSTGSLAASIVPSGQPSSFAAGGSATYQVTLTNNGSQTWPAGGNNPVHLGIHFTNQGGGYATNGSNWATDQRVNLPNDVAPGGSVTITVTVTAPSTPGNYVLEYQMVQEWVAWFPQYLDSQAAVGTGNPSFPAGTTYVTTTPDGQVISERLPNGSGGYTSYYYVHDGLGSVVGLTDGSGNVVNRYAYDPYGNATSVSEQVANPFRYIGAIYDSSTGLYKMGERYYDPTMGRFTQEDPLGGGYAYAGDNPINAVDPSGLVEDSLAGELGGGGGAVAGAGPGPGVAIVAAAAYVGSLIGEAIHTVLSKDSSETVGQILKRKKGSIKNAPLPPGSPGWDEIEKMTWDQIEAGLKAGKPGYKTLKKLLTNKRFNK